MNDLLRIFAVVFIVGLLTAGVFAIRDACSPGEMLRVNRRREELLRLRAAILRRQEGQFQAAQDWLTQRCTWEETMRRFQDLDWELDQTSPGYSKKVEEDARQSAEELHYRFIFDYVKSVLRNRPEELTAALRRLEKDSQRLQPGSPRRETAAKDR